MFNWLLEFFADDVTHFGLSFIHGLHLSVGHGTVIIPLLILGYIWCDQKVFFHATCATLATIILNYVLKITFRVPLAFDPKKFAYPSGHMQCGVALYGYLLTQLKHPFCKTLLIFILFGLASSLVHFGYHNYFDIVGAIFFSSLLIVGYLFMVDKDRQDLFLVAFIFITLTLVCIGFVDEIRLHIWRAFYALTGLVVAERIFSQSTLNTTQKTKLMATFFSFTMLVMIQKLFSLVDLPVFLAQMQWAMISFCVPFSLHRLHYYLKPKHSAKT